jgi:hypothetical protein
MPRKWIERGAEPSLRELMDDPLTKAVMQRDGLTAEQVWIAIREAQRKLAQQSSAEPRAGGFGNMA